MPSFKDEHVLIIAPGSHMTLAQLGIPDSLTPAKLHIPSRMFPAEGLEGEWEPFKVTKRVVEMPVRNDVAVHEHDQDLEMKDVGAEETSAATPEETDAADTQHSNALSDTETEKEATLIYEEDTSTTEGAVYPIVKGKIVNWPCFFALLQHIYNTIQPPFHTPILLVADPVWSLKDHEILTQFIFEKFKPPGFCLIDSAIAACYAYGVSHAAVVDVGYEKADVTAVTDFLVNDLGRTMGLDDCGGEAMTDHLYSLLRSKGFTRDMCEQLKQSAICEILPSGVPLPLSNPERNGAATNSAAAAGTGTATGAEAGASATAGVGPSPSPGVTTSTARLGQGQRKEGKDNHDDEGVLDVASIVASGKTSEFLAQKEREKAEKAAVKAKPDAATILKQPRLKNFEKRKTTFIYEERVPLDEFNEYGSKDSSNDDADKDNETDHQKTPDAEASAHATAGTEPLSEVTEQENTTSKVETPASKDLTPEIKEPVEEQIAQPHSAIVHKEIEVGLERFKAAECGILEAIADALHRTILSVPDIGKRADLWDSLIIIGNGSKIRGFTAALINVINTKYLISPSSATIFTSELPSNLSTPAATGANTPVARDPSTTHTTVNPLLLAATTASHPPLGSTPSNFRDSSHVSDGGAAGHPHHSGHSQTPTSIKTAKTPEYFPEWKEAGFEEAVFLGAQVAAKVIYVVDQGLSKGFMTRTEYNEMGPQGIHEISI